MSEYRFDLRKQFPLTGVGTRWEHYSELREVFALGISVIEQTNPVYRSPMDTKKLVKLKDAVELIDARMALLSGFDDQNRTYGDFDLMLRKMDGEKIRNEGWAKEIKPMPLLTEGKKDEAAKDSNLSSDKKDSQAPPDEPVGV